MADRADHLAAHGRVHLYDAVTGMPLCLEADYRDTLTDDGLWDYVLNGDRPGEQPDDDQPEQDVVSLDADPCAECGESDACGYDAEGRPWIHVTTEADR